MEPYNPKTLEPKWQAVWAETPELYAAVDGEGARPKQYILVEFPYPSGDGLHAGHVRSYTAQDIVARRARMMGHNVLYPMGWDAFGLPTENFAIKHKIAPQVATAKNIATFKRQMQDMGFSFDWSREINTTDPAYYKWTQWIFLQLYKKGLAYQAEIPINWCPTCKTGLANEEVVNGRHERCGTLVEKRQLKQWLLKITTYADRLIKDLESVDYSERIATQQVNWVGKSHGVELTFKVEGSKATIHTFTTRVDTLYGATFLVLAPEHPLVSELVKSGHKEQVNSYLKSIASRSELDRQQEEGEKTGVPTGSYAINPINGQKIPIWIADYVLMGYGTGAIMAVPAHDGRDAAFARKYDLPLVWVYDQPGAKAGEIYHGEGVIKNSGKYDGLTTQAARKQIARDLKTKGAAQPKVNYKLRDWIFSRQHYWGEPIPVIHCSKCGAVAVPETDLPVELPPVEHYEPTDTGESPLAAINEWVNVDCPKCGGPAKRETDTMPNWAGSSWYYLRYLDPHNDKRLAEAAKLKYWLPVDLYNGGMEHTTLHLLYSRFWHKFLYDLKIVPTKEPYAKRRSHGMILAVDGKKMSKSLGNVVNPDEAVKDYGADTLRLHQMFMGPYDQAVAWDHQGLVGTRRFLERVWNLVQEFMQTPEAENTLAEGGATSETALAVATQRATKRISQDLDQREFNTAVSALMELVNALYKLKAELPFGAAREAWQQNLSDLLRLLAPFAPHITEELWQKLGESQSIHLQLWPDWDEKLIKDELATLVVQINGKVRADIAISVGISKAAAVKAAQADARVQKYLEGHKLLKTIFVADKLINFVVK